MSVVLYPGSFDPFHLGHLDVVNQAAVLFGEVIIGVMHNPEKSSATFSVDQRIAMIEESVKHLPSISVQAFAGLAVDAAKSCRALCILKGLRTMSDFELEQQMAQTNFLISGVRTVYVPCAPALGFISSRFIREIAHFGGDTSAMVPSAVGNVLNKTYPPRSKK